VLRIFNVIAVLQLLSLTPVWACSGQVGSVIFQDDFSDDSGGWDEAPPYASVQPPVFVFALNASYIAFSSHNLSFNAIDGDYCMDFILPPAIAAGNQMYTGIDFWALDYDNVWNFNTGSDGSLFLQRKSSGKWATLWTVSNSPAFLSAANAVNSLRLTALNGLITTYLNGTMIKATRAPEPTGSNIMFGMMAAVNTAVDNAPKVQVKAFSVTVGK